MNIDPSMLGLYLYVCRPKLVHLMLKLGLPRRGEAELLVIHLGWIVVVIVAIRDRCEDECSRTRSDANRERVRG